MSSVTEMVNIIIIIKNVVVLFRKTKTRKTNQVKSSMSCGKDSCRKVQKTQENGTYCGKNKSQDARRVIFFLRCLYVSCETSRIFNGCVLIASQFRKKTRIISLVILACAYGIRRKRCNFRIKMSTDLIMFFHQPGYSHEKNKIRESKEIKE